MARLSLSQVQDRSASCSSISGRRAWWGALVPRVDLRKAVSKVLPILHVAEPLLRNLDRKTPRLPGENDFGRGEKCSCRHRAWQEEVLQGPPQVFPSLPHRIPSHSFTPCLCTPLTKTLTMSASATVPLTGPLLVTPSLFCPRKGRGGVAVGHFLLGQVLRYNGAVATRPFSWLLGP